MSDVKQIFEDYIKDEGLGRIYTGNNEHIRRIYHDFNNAILIQMQNNANLPTPNFYVTTLSSELSAFVFKEQEKYFIGISIGAIESLSKFFQFLYSQPYFDSELGDSAKETETVLDMSLNPDYLLDYFYNYDLNVKPKCPIRNSYSYQVFYKAINYLLLHEYAHITHGHLDYLSSGKKNYLYYEKDTISIKNADIEKALEYDADATATVSLMVDSTGYLFFGELFNNSISLEIEIKKSNIEVYFLNKLTEFTDIELEDYSHKTHPLSDQRTSSHSALVKTYLLELQGASDMKSIANIGSKVINEIAMPGYSKLFNKEVLDDRLIFFYSKQGLPYINNVRRGWNKVRKDLEKYAYVTLAPDDEMIKDHGLIDYNYFFKKKRDKNVDSGGEI